MITAGTMRQRLFELKDQNEPITIRDLIGYATEVETAWREDLEAADRAIYDHWKTDVEPDLETAEDPEAEIRLAKENDQLLRDTIDQEARKVINTDHLTHGKEIKETRAWDAAINRIFEVAERDMGRLDAEQADYLAEELDLTIERFTAPARLPGY